MKELLKKLSNDEINELSGEILRRLSGNSGGARENDLNAENSLLDEDFELVRSESVVDRIISELEERGMISASSEAEAPDKPLDALYADMTSKQEDSDKPQAEISQMRRQMQELSELSQKRRGYRGADAEQMATTENVLHRMRTDPTEGGLLMGEVSEYFRRDSRRYDNGYEKY